MAIAFAMAMMILFLAIREASRGVKRKIEQLEFSLEELLNRGYNGGKLFINHEKTKYFLQFYKYEKSKDNTGICLSFPNCSWSNGFYKNLKKYLDQEGIGYDISSGSDSLEFIDIDFKKDIKKAYEVVKYILIDQFKIERNEIVRIKLENARA